MSSSNLIQVTDPIVRHSPEGKTEATNLSAGRKLLGDLLRQFSEGKTPAPASLTAQLEDLKKENDEGLLAQSLLDIGVSLKADHHLQAAHTILASLAEADIAPEIKSKAKAEASALLGAGSNGLRAEFLLSRFCHDATDPRLIAPMLAGSLVGEVVGTAVLGRLVATGSRASASWMTRGFGARLAAGSVGYLSEVSTFATLNRALSPAHEGPFSEDLARAALTIGALKLSGWAGKGLGETLASPASGAGIQRQTSWALAHGSTFLGLAASHKLEENLGLRKHVEGATFMLDTLSSLVSLSVGARLGRGTLGEGFSRFHTELGLRADLNNKAANLSPVLPGRQLAMAQAHDGAPVFMAMSGFGGGNSGNGGKPRPDSVTEIADIDIQLEGSEGTIYGAPGQKAQPAPSQALLAPQAPLPPPAPLPAPVTSDPYIGKTIDGRYIIQGVLGRGGMGVVYGCRHAVFDKPFAMKVLKGEMGRDREVTTRFLNEAKAASAIGNPHIIDISDFGQFPDGSPYIVMEFLKGKALSHLIDYKESVPLPRFVNIARQLAEGLSAAHKAGIVHRDLKPDNIYLIPRGNDPDFVKILDFGIAKVPNVQTKNKLTQDGSVFGTPHYMSPEQAAGIPVDQRGDIYSYGIILYELASGKIPFDSENMSQIITSQMFKPVPPLREMMKNPDDLHPGLEAIIMKCLTKKPELRYQTMDELISDLDKLRAGFAPEAVAELQARTEEDHEPVDYFHVGKDRLTPRSRFRKRLPIYAGLGGLGGLAIFTAVFLGAGKSQDDKKTPPANDDFPKPNKITVTDAPPAPTTKHIALRIDPEDAHAYKGDEDLGVSEVLLELKQGETVELEIRREGYKTKKIKLDGSQEKSAVRLEKEASPKPSGKPPAKNSGGNSSTPIKPKPVPSDGVVSPWK
ncbi:MAG: serine/threonine protein kinase [Deltaproteobacteria bacterium]|nr:serine/threonine protein kinase [Deltaproteobacteria bacterium]